jgi:glycosyltransferase involved in cell wall biosynthesis
MEALIQARGVGDVLWLAGEQPQIPALLHAMDLFVLASRHEGMPNALMEAMAAGRACVATDVGDSARVVVPGETGFIVPVGDVPALSERVRELAHDAALRQRMGARGQTRIEREFAIPAMVQRYRDLYTRLVQS